MSFSAEQATAFFAPLKGKTSSFIVEDRRTNLHLARALAQLAAKSGDGCTIFDLDALYVSNSDKIFGGLTQTQSKPTTIHVPAPGSRVEDEFPKLFATGSGLLVVDSFNSFYHLLSSDDARSRGRKLAFAVSSLSYLARTEGLPVIFNLYKRERQSIPGRRRSISDLTDSSFAVEARDSEVSMKSERGETWPGGKLSVPVRFP